MNVRFVFKDVEGDTEDCKSRYQLRASVSPSYLPLIGRTFSAVEGIDHCIFIYNGASGRVNENDVLLHLVEFWKHRATMSLLHLKT